MASNVKSKARRGPTERMQRTNSDLWEKVSARGEEISSTIRLDADRLLRQTVGLPERRTLGRDDILLWVERTQHVMSKASKEQQLEVVAHAYALYASLKHAAEFGAIIEQLAQKTGKKPTKRTHPLHVIVESMIAYGGSDRRAKENARRLYSRDVQAIRWLIREDVRPCDVVSKGQEKGEGLDAWSRRYGEQRKSSVTPKSPAAGGHYLEVKRRLPEGSTILLKRISLDHLTGERWEHFMERLSELQVGGRSTAVQTSGTNNAGG